VSSMIDPEDAAALAVLEELGRIAGPEATSVPEPEDEVEEVLRRLFHETAGLLPYALAPEATSAELRARVLHAAVGDETQEVPPLEEEVAAAEVDTGGGRAAPGVPAGWPPPAPVPAPDLGFTRAARVARPRGWMALAAVLALAVAGLGFWAAYLQSELNADRARLAWAEREWRGEAAEARAALTEMRGKLDLFTAPAVEIFPLRAGAGPAAGARVYLYVTPDRKRWGLATHGLEPEPAGHDYQVWFLVGDEPRSAGCFNMRDGKPVISMPMGAPQGITGAAVTIEPHGGSKRPTTAVLLQADHSIRL